MAAIKFYMGHSTIFMPSLLIKTSQPLSGKKSMLKETSIQAEGRNMPF